MQDSSSEQDRKPSAGPAGETAAAQITTQAAEGGAAGGVATDAGAVDRGAPGGSAADEGAADAGAADGAGQDSPAEDGPGPGAGGRRYGRLAMAVGAAVIVAVAAFAAFTAAGGLSGPARPSSAIPGPPRENKTFVEDDDGTGADSQANILHSAAPGLVHVLSARGTPAGAGVILTPSGLVLTSNQVLQGARQVTVRVVLSGRSFPARLVGADASHGLGLLQIVGGPAFRPIAVGNSGYLSRGAAVTAVGSSGLTRTFTLNIGNLTGGTGAVADGGQQLTGLLVSTARVMAGEETGGPLVNLSGQAIGINVAGTGSGLHRTGYAVPIDEALAVAKSIQASHSG
jgi:S1-C subfamily serine protease